jgi:hypothetical protein
MAPNSTMEEVTDINSYVDSMRSVLVEYNNQHSEKMDMYLFSSSVLHIAR